MSDTNSLKSILSKMEEVWTQMRAIIDEANEAGEPLTAEMQERYNKLKLEYDKQEARRNINVQHLEDTVKYHETRNKPIREDVIEAAKFAVGARANGENGPATMQLSRAITPTPNGRLIWTEKEERAAKQVMETFGINRSGYIDALDDSEDEDEGPRNWRAAATKLYRRAFRAYHNRPNRMQPDELRILNETTVADGGYLPSVEYYGNLITTRQLTNFLRAISTVITLGTKTGNVTFEASIGQAMYENESTPSPGTTPQFDNLTLSSKKLVYLAKITEELLADDRFQTDAWISSMIGRNFGQTELAAMLGGPALGADYTNGPAGLKSIVTVGNSNLVTTATAGVLTSNEIIDVYYKVPLQYRTNAVWVLHDTAAAAIRKMTMPTTGTGSAGVAATPYLWEPSFQEGVPDKLLGRPVYTTNVGLDAFATGGKKVALFGDFSFHFIADRDSMSIRFLQEAFIASGQYAWRAVARHDAGWTIKAAIAGLAIA